MCVCVGGGGVREGEPEQKEPLTRSTQEVIKARLSIKPSSAQSRQPKYSTD